MNIQIQELAQLGLQSVHLTAKGHPVRPTPIRGTMKNSYRISNGHTYVWCENLEHLGSFDWFRNDKLTQVQL